MLQQFTTKASNRFERSRQWCAFTRADHVEIGDGCEASLRGGDFGAVRLCSVSMGRHHINQHSVDGLCMGPVLKFIFQSEGRAEVCQQGRVIEVQSGQWCALRKDVPYTIDAPIFSRQLTVSIPCELIPGARRGFDWWGKPRTYRRGAAQILHACAEASLLSTRDLSAHDGGTIGQQIVQLIEMTLRAEGVDSLGDVKEERRHAILQYIDQCLDDPDLSVATIAHEFGCSTRTVHKLFEDEPYTVARLIWDRRLERCRDEMLDLSMADRSITEIAHRWAFGDSQHFSRAFRSRYGITPRDYRNQHMT